VSAEIGATVLAIVNNSMRRQLEVGDSLCLDRSGSLSGRGNDFGIILSVAHVKSTEENYSHQARINACNKELTI
jgi:hypothetical protein